MKLKFILPFLALTTGLFTQACNNNTPTESTENSSQPQEHHAPQHAQSNQSEAAAPSTANAVSNAIPSFTFYKVKSGIAYTNADLQEGKNTVFILFDPSCSHCQNEAGALAKNYDKIKDVNILYISMNDPALMVNFFNTFGKELQGKANIEMLYDRNQEFVQKIHIPAIFPANYVYGPDGILKSSWEGEKDINEAIAEFVK